MNEDLGWQQPAIYQATRAKFHYFVVENQDHKFPWQRSLCRKYGVPKTAIWQNVERQQGPPSQDDCKECSRRWEKSYGKKEK